MKRKIVGAIVIVLVVFGGLAGIKTRQIQSLIAAGKTMVPPPESISTDVAREERWQESLEAIGSITAVQGVNLTPEVAGTVSEIAFESGAVVKQGDLLVCLDTSSEKAQLRALDAQAHLARLNADRTRQLRADNTVSQAELDSAVAALNQTQANADALKVAIEKKTIRAPFAGKLGIRQVNLGEYLNPGKMIVSLQALAPVYADFSLPQQELSRVEPGMPVVVTTDTYTNQQFRGVLTAINPDLDPVTRSVRLQATLANTNELLRPGMYGRVRVLLPVEKSVLVIRSTSILSAPYSDLVFVVGQSTNSPDTLVVQQRLVRTGRTLGDFVAVESGLKAGERVASSGLFKLRNGMTVVENNEIVPKAAEAPRPPDR